MATSAESLANEKSELPQPVLPFPARAGGPQDCQMHSSTPCPDEKPEQKQGWAETDVEAQKDAEDKGKEEESESEPKPARMFAISAHVRIGGTILAMNAGMVNAIAFHALHSFVSHLTGTLSKVAIGVEDDQKAEADTAALIVVSFVLGSALTGFLVAKDTIHFGMALYDLCLLSESVLLVITTCLHEHKVAIYVAAAACGLQNGMATHWGGAVVRTTHVTGLFTDVGLALGRLLSLFCRKRCGAKFDAFDHALVADDLSKLSLLLSIAFCFVCGVFAGAHLHQGLEHLAFLVPASITGIMGLAYLIYRVFVLGKSLFSDEEMEAVEVFGPMEAEVLEAMQAQDLSPCSPKSPCSPMRPRSASGNSWDRSGNTWVISREQAIKFELNRGGQSPRQLPKSTTDFGQC